MSESPGSVTERTEHRYILPHAVPSRMLSAEGAAGMRYGARAGRRLRGRSIRAAGRGHHWDRSPGECWGGGGGAAAHSRCSGARPSSRAWRSTRSLTCAAAGSCSRSARAWLRDMRGHVSGRRGRVARGCSARVGLAERTFARAQRLERRLVAEESLPRLHDERQPRVDALNATLLLLRVQQTGAREMAARSGAEGRRSAVRVSPRPKRRPEMGRPPTPDPPPRPGESPPCPRQAW